MEKIIIIPEGIEVQIDNCKVLVKGEKDKSERDFYSVLFRDLKIEKIDNSIKVSYPSEKRKHKAMVGTVTAHINNMIKGLTEGFTYEMKIVYMHFPMKVEVKEKEVHISNFLGEKSKRKAKIVGDTNIEVKDDQIIVTGINKEDVGQTCNNLELAVKISRRDRRVFQDSIVITKKG